MACCPCMGEQVNNSALGKLTLNFPKFAWETYRTEVSICQRKVPARASQQNKTTVVKILGTAKGKINDLSYCVLLSVN